MRPYATRLLTLAIYATAAVVIPAITATQAEAASRHQRKHHKRINPAWNDPRRMNPGWNDPWAAQRIRPVAPPYNPRGPACPGSARSIDCKVWPPPMDEDPDRKISGADV